GPHRKKMIVGGHPFELRLSRRSRDSVHLPPRLRCFPPQNLESCPIAIILSEPADLCVLSHRSRQCHFSWWRRCARQLPQSVGVRRSHTAHDREIEVLQVVAVFHAVLSARRLMLVIVIF